jgi:hypothetical protein
MKLRCVVLVAMAGACGRKPAATPAQDAGPVARVVATPGIDAAVQPAVPTTYALADAGLAVQVLLVAPARWSDRYDPPERIAFTTEQGSWVTIGVGTPSEVAAGTFALTEHHPVAIADQADGRTLDCTIALVQADLGEKEAMGALCAGVDARAVPDDRVAWTIEVTPSTVALADQEQVEIRFTATNQSDKTLDPTRSSLTIEIDGETPQVLGLAFGNGGRGREWSALPPGDAASDSRSGMKLVDAAGDHVVSLSRMGHELARTTLHVTR